MLQASCLREAKLCLALFVASSVILPTCARANPSAILPAVAPAPAPTPTPAPAQAQVGSFAQGERPMYLEFPPLVEGQSIHLELRNVPAGAKNPLLVFSTVVQTTSVAPNVPGLLGPDLAHGGVISMDPNSFTYDDVLNAGTAGATVYLQAYVDVASGGRLSTMTTAHVIKAGTDPGTAPTITFPLPLTTEQVLTTGVAGLDLTQAPVRVGLPMPKGQVFEKNGVPQLQVKGGTTAQQFNTLTKWSDGSCKWVLCEYLADVKKGVSTTAYSVDKGLGNSSGANLATVSGTTTTIDTGALKVQFDPTTANLFDLYQLHGRDVFDSTKGNAPHFFDDQDVEWHWAETAVTVRRNGPVRAEVEVDGVFTQSTSSSDPNRIYVVLYFEATKNGSSLRATCSLRDTSVQYPQAMVSRGFTLRAYLKDAGPYNVRMSSVSTDGTTPGVVSGSLASAATDASYYQGFARSTKIELTTDPNSSLYVPFVQRFGTDNFAIEGVRARIDKSYFTGSSTSGWWSQQNEFANSTFVESNASNGHGVMVGLEHANTTWPAELQLGGDGRVEIGILPRKVAGDTFDYAMPWATAETRWFWILAEDVPAPDTYAASSLFDYPLTARADPWVYNQSDVWHWRLVSHQNLVDYCNFSGLKLPVPPVIDPVKTLFIYANMTGGQNNQWGNTQHFYQYLRTGDGGSWLASWFEAFYKADKMPWIVDDDVLKNRKAIRTVAHPYTNKNDLYNNSKHTFVQVLCDWALTRGETRLLDSARAWSETLQDPIISANVQPNGNFISGPFGAMTEASCGILEMYSDANLSNWLHNYVYQWANIVFQTSNNFGVNTAQKGWQAPPGTATGAANPDGYIVSWSAGKSSDRQNYGYVTQGWTELRLGAQAYHRYVHYLREANPTDSLITDLTNRANDWYHYFHRCMHDDYSAATGDFFEIDVFAGDAGNPSPNPFDPPGPLDIDVPDPSGYAFHGIVNFKLDTTPSETALSYGVEMHRSIAKNQYDGLINDPMLNEFIWRYCVHYGLLKP